MSGIAKETIDTILGIAIAQVKRQFPAVKTTSQALEMIKDALPVYTERQQK